MYKIIQYKPQKNTLNKKTNILINLKETPENIKNISEKKVNLNGTEHFTMHSKNQKKTQTWKQINKTTIYKNITSTTNQIKFIKFQKKSRRT